MKKTKNLRHREYLPTLADLVDSLTINQIKEIKFRKKKDVYAQELKKICHDIDQIIDEKNIKINARFIRILIIIAQLNLYIWENKDRMQNENSENYLKLLKFSHQLNGIRNIMKNKILEEISERNPSKMRTNIETDDLEGWDISVD